MVGGTIEKSNFCVSKNIQQFKKAFQLKLKINNALKKIKSLYLKKNCLPTKKLKKIDQINPVDPIAGSKARLITKDKH